MANNILGVIARGLRRIAPTRSILSSKGVVGSELLNRAGLQVARVALARAGSKFRQLRKPAEDALELSIRSSGYCVIRNFLPPDVFEAVRIEYWEIMRNPGIPKRVIRDSTGCVRETYYVEADGPSRNCVEHIRKNKTLRRLLMCSEGVTEDAWHRGVFQVAFWRQRMDDGSFANALDSDHSNAEFHADTFHAISKGFFYVEPVDSRNGAHRYVPHSHRLTLARLGFEYRNSISSRLNSPRVAERELGRFGRDAVTLILPENALIVENTFGFHAAGQIEPGRERNLIYVQFRWPPFGRLTQPDGQ